jgi:DNA-binding NarL/FixJ family response regulator
MSEEDWNLLNRLCNGAHSQLVIVILGSVSAFAGVRAVRAGAHSVVARESTLATLQRTVEATIAGQAVMPATVAAALAGTSGEGKRMPSAKQISWLQRLASGTTVAQLANRAGYSEREMYRLLRSLYAQMGVRTRLQAIMHAKEADWI